ncbi:conjugative transfer system coupling protein TraD [Cupriavidus sp. UYPR2.512]|uniref:conjugative transfer system coupling protein TraD n=1 Tax=Cupriavidus sp. UYPR2.512 TaxID=1080187 RepID=UPI0004762763|nr:conjugative transfer system coupling protein TraD [Cupriavidus sp. UYPR2.512]UIF89212.1 conjugative transfer system coupling protein TraD [Cupriavidus necator]
MKTYHDMFRPAYEIPAAAAWALGGTALIASCAIGSMPIDWALFGVACFAFAGRRWAQAADLFRFRLSLSGYRVEEITVAELMERSKQMSDAKKLYIGNGFEWDQREAEISKHLLRRGKANIPPLPTWLPKPLVEAMKPLGWKPVDDSKIGVPWIHGINPNEHQIGAGFETLTGHTLVAGTTRAGKTKFYEMLLTQLVHMRKTIIFVDPKGDKDIEDRLRAECARTGRRFYYFHPAHPSRSIRLSILANWNNISDLASRISEQVDANGSFQAFAWKTLYGIIRGELMDGRNPTIRSVKRWAQVGVEELLASILRKWFHTHAGQTWEQDAKAFVDPKSPSPLLAWISLYTKTCQDKEIPFDETIDALCAMVKHSKEHYSKMIQVLEPLLEMLGSEEVGRMLSPDPTDVFDERDIMDTRKIIAEGAVLYVGLDSLSNTTIGSAIGSIILADLASVCGAIYNFEGKNDVHLFVDEASEALNAQLIQILNKGGGAGMQCYIATQTISDFIARMGSKDKAMQVLGNLNNVITLRLKDYETAKWIAQSFGQTGFRDESRSVNSGRNSTSHPTDFSGSGGRSMTVKDIALVSEDLLTRLPPMNYFAFIGGSWLYKGRVPIISR